jgi:zinc protease
VLEVDPMHRPFPLRPRFGAVIAAAWLAATLTAAPASLEAKIFEPESFVLDNGLQVVVIANHRAPIVTHMIWYKVGAADEDPGKSGLAHFLEHLMFKGTESLGPGKFSEIIAANGGQENAFRASDPENSPRSSPPMAARKTPSPPRTPRAISRPSIAIGSRSSWSTRPTA